MQVLLDGARRGSPRTAPELRLLVAGRGDAEDVLADAAAGTARPGRRSSAWSARRTRRGCCARVDVYVAPNTGGESFGIILLEAMAAGAPVVASDLDAFRRVLDDGRPARCSATGDAAARWRTGWPGCSTTRPQRAAAGRRRHRGGRAVRLGRSWPRRSSRCTRRSSPLTRSRVRRRTRRGRPGRFTRRERTAYPDQLVRVVIAAVVVPWSCFDLRSSWPRPGWTGCTCASRRPRRRWTPSWSAARPPPLQVARRARRTRADPSVLLAELLRSWRARLAGRPTTHREAAENELSWALRADFADDGADARPAADGRRSPSAARAGWSLARRFYNDAVRDTRALRRRRMPRLLRLAGTAPLPRVLRDRRHAAAAPDLQRTAWITVAPPTARSRVRRTRSAACIAGWSSLRSCSARLPRAATTGPPRPPGRTASPQRRRADAVADPDADPPARSRSRRRRRSNPLTGLRGVPRRRCSSSRSTTPRSGRPQVGLERADVVYVEQVEGGLTRLAAVFATGIPAWSVRSAASRIADPELLPQYGTIRARLLRRRRRCRSVVRAARR